MSIITDVYHKGANERSAKIDTNDIKDLKIDRLQGYVEINYKNGNQTGSRLTNFSKEDFTILENLENIYTKDYRLDLIDNIKNPKLKKLYQKWGMNETTYLITQYLCDVLGDDGVMFNSYRDNLEQEKHKDKLHKDFEWLTTAENMKDFFNSLQIKELNKYAKFVFIK